MKTTFERRNVYKGMIAIALLIVAVFAVLFILNKGGIPTGLNNLIDPNGAPQFSYQIYGDFDNTMQKPMDTTVSGSFIYVTDAKEKRIIVFDSGGTPLFTFGKDGTKEGQFKFPYGISTDGKGQIYVADLYNGKISIHNEKGEFKGYFAAKNKEITAPAGLRIIGDKVYVTDVQENKVFVFSLDGKLLLKIGKPGKGQGEFVAPNAITADADGNIYVVDTGNQRVQVFDSKGKFTKFINGSTNGTGVSSFVNPRGIGIDDRGIIYVVSNLTHTVFGFNEKGEKMFQFGGQGEENGKFSLPNGLNIDANGNVYVTDTLNTRVSVFR